ncbi:hypothetical protein VMCG_01465 [Cytospora schulzeri]|uniref:Uncharacterized protein n=1 Tax=Cytospora schulzeri TaxID=448051 RepID=A0A423X636_9PEZI|nr:hypothetical protein VMCG_01465 [Valsa malicola]
MCIQKITYQCRHSRLQQLPCDNTKQVKKRCWFRFGPAKPAEPVPCYRRYDWKLHESCSECRMFMLEGVTLDDLREAQKQRSQGYAEPVEPPRHYATPRPVGGIHVEPEDSRDAPRFATPKPVGGIYPLPPSAQDAGDLSPDSHYEASIFSDVTEWPRYDDVTAPVQARAPRPDSRYEPGVNAEVANLPGYYDVSAPVQATRAPRPDSYYEPGINAEVASLPGYYDVSAPVQARSPSLGSHYEPEVNADVANLPGYYDVPASARLTVPLQFHYARPGDSRTVSIKPAGRNVGTWNWLGASETRTSRVDSKDWYLIHQRNLRGPLCKPKATTFWASLPNQACE